MHRTTIDRGKQSGLTFHVLLVQDIAIVNWVGRSQDALLRRLVFVIGGGVGSGVVDWKEEEEEEEEERVLAWWFCHGYWGGDCGFWVWKGGRVCQLKLPRLR